MVAGSNPVWEEPPAGSPGQAAGGGSAAHTADRLGGKVAVIEALAEVEALPLFVGQAAHQIAAGLEVIECLGAVPGHQRIPVGEGMSFRHPPEFATGVVVVSDGDLP